VLLDEHAGGSDERAQPFAPHGKAEARMRPSYARAIPRAWRQTARMFVALGDPHRQRIILMFEPGEQLNVGQIVAASTLSRSAVAHHLKVLREAGVLRSEKIGKEVWYRTDPDAVREALSAVLDYVADHS
jgi:DNA-binding transcriptional ArsR family regulator